MASGRGADTGRGCLLFGDKRAGRIQILRNLVRRNKGHPAGTVCTMYVQCRLDMFKTHVKNAIKKAKMLKGVIKNVTADT